MTKCSACEEWIDPAVHFVRLENDDYCLTCFRAIGSANYNSGMPLHDGPADIVPWYREVVAPFYWNTPTPTELLRTGVVSRS